jgi:hypothetical protein
MVASYSWNKAVPPSGYDGDCYSWGNYLAVSAWDGVYRLKWQLLRRNGSGGFERVPESRSFTQTFALRPSGQIDVEQALRWAENQIVQYRARRKVQESDIL